MARVILAVDGNSLVHRSFHAQAKTGLRSADGRPMWAVRGLLSQLVAAVERIGPDAVIVGFDDPDSSQRRRQWPHYKATRTEKLATLVDQLALAADVLRQLGVAVVVPPGLEADDVLASTARWAADAGATTVVVTSDRDAFALIDANTRVLRIINGGVEASPLLTEDRLVTLLGVRADQYRDYAALRGDPSDNLCGVSGIGPKTAVRLLSALGSAEAAFDDVNAGGARVAAAVGRSAALRLAHPQARDTWALNCQVMRMHHDVALDVSLGDGIGNLPLAAPAVRAAFETQQLPATMATALHVLAGQEAPATSWSRPWTPSTASTIARHPWPPAPDSYVSPRSPSPDSYRSGRRHPVAARRPAPAPRSEQLSLFD